MTQNEFIIELRRGLSGLPGRDIEERVSFYSEMIDDRIEEGLKEEEAVAAVGKLEDIVEQIVADTPFVKIAKERMRPKRRMKAWEIVLLAVGSPIWIAIGVAIAAVILAVYAVLWSLVISLWAIFASLAASAVGVAGVGIIYIVTGNVLSGIGSIGLAPILAGVAIFIFFGCRAATKGTAVLTGKIAVWIKNCFIKKEVA